MFECIGIAGETKRKNELEFTEEKQNEISTNIIPKVPRIELIKSKEEQALNELGPAVVTSNMKPLTNEIRETMKPSNAIIRKPVKPKTELELRILETQDEHPSKKKDLFRAIFDSDSDNDDNNDDYEEKSETSNKSETILQLAQQSTLAAANVIYSSIPDDAFMPKSAKEINVLRNTSPPRGIFKSLAEMEPSGMFKVTTKTNDDEPCSLPIPNSYGPSLPPKDTSLDIVPTITKTNQVTIFSESENSHDEWIERTSSKKKKTKKHKVDKHKKKKSKKSKRRH